MKTLLVISCVLLAVAFSNGQEDVVRQYVETMKETAEMCAKEVNTPLEELIQAIAKRDGTAEQKAGCYLACTFKREGYMKDGKIQLENLKKSADEMYKDNPAEAKRSNDINAECIANATPESDECKLVYNQINCFLEKMGYPASG